MATYGREVITNELSSGSGTFFLDNNHANVAAGSLSPYWVQDFGRGGLMLLRYTWGRVMYDDHGISGRNAGLLNGITDSTSNALQFSLSSPEYQTWAGMSAIRISASNRIPDAVSNTRLPSWAPRGKSATT
jgi:hypothetical protein